MAKYVLIPDSFKGTLSSADICRIASEEILRLEPEAKICAIPVADGGEGTVDAFLAAVGGTRAEVPCTGPCGQEVMGFYGLLPDGTAVVEMAAAAGLPLAGACRDPEKTTTYGVGQLMAHALSRGAKRLVLGLGGSATNDGGCGAAAALGADPADCVVFEDALAGIESARRAGAGRIVALATTLTREQLLAEGGADAVVGSFAEITDADLN